MQEQEKTKTINQIRELWERFDDLRDCYRGLELILDDYEKKSKKEEAEGMLEGLESLKSYNPKFKSPEGYAKRLEREILKISKETHNFPHYTTCRTCEDGWDMEIDFLIKELKKSSKYLASLPLR